MPVGGVEVEVCVCVGVISGSMVSIGASGGCGGGGVCVGGCDEWFNGEYWCQCGGGGGGV